MIQSLTTYVALLDFECESIFLDIRLVAYIVRYFSQLILQALEYNVIQVGHSSAEVEKIFYFLSTR